MRSGKRGLWAGVSAGALAASVANAQVTPAAPAAPAPAAASADTGQIADIVVTATRRQERLQDVPVSVTALSAQTIERQNVRDVSDLPKLVPGLTVSYGSQPGNFVINMRGVGTFSGGIAVESDVAVVIDDVPVGFQAEAFKDLIDVERVEALKGPQSTLFGKSAIAGVLNITTQAPTDHWTGHATALVTDDREWRIGGTVSGPISDTLKFRLTGSRTLWDGNVHDISIHKWENGSKGYTFTGKLQWDPTSNVSMTLAPRYNVTDSSCCVSPITSLQPGFLFQGLPQYPESVVLAGIDYNNPHNRKIRQDERAGGDARTYGATLHAAYTLDPDGKFLPGATLTYIGSFDRYRMFDFQDTDGTDVPFLLYYPVANPAGLDHGSRIRGYFHTNSVTQELRLTSPGHQPFRYTAGLWYAHNALDRFFDRGPVFQNIQYLAVSHNTTYSAYTDFAWDVVPKLTLVGGFRLNRQEIDYSFDNYTASPPFHLAGANSQNAITGKVGAQYHFTHDIMAYATFSTGYKGQAYDLVSTFNARTASRMPVPSETAKNYEVGLKTSLFDHKLNLNAAAFWTDFTGFQTQVTSFLPDGTFLTALNSVGKLRSRGIELDMQARPTRRLQINGAAAFTDAKITDFPNGPCYTGQTLAQGCYVDATNSRVQDLKGKRLNNAPKFKFNIGGEYDVPIGADYQGFLTFAYRWQSKINFSLSQDPATVQRSYGIFDAGIGASTGEGRYKLTFFVNNLFDKQYAANLVNTSSGFNNGGSVAATGTAWQPARDAYRYIGVRGDVAF
jgi:iron complex outermembrane recepter protein